MMNQNNIDEIDKMFSDYFNDIDKIPDSTRITIDNSLNEIKNSKKHSFKLPSFSKTQRIATLLISILFVSSTAVFAKNIIIIITALFTNTTKGILDAVDNGYVQHVNMDYVYDNGIGIKVNDIVADDTNLNISYEYKVDGYENINEIVLTDYLIRDENNNLVYYYFKDTNKMNFVKTLTNNRSKSDFSMISKKNHTFTNSILYTSDKFPKFENLQFEVYSLSIIDDNNTNDISGNWIFNLDLENMMIARTSEAYSYTYSPYIENISSKLTDTSLFIDIKLNTIFNKNILKKPGNISLKYINKNQIRHKKINYNNNNSIINIEFDLSTYSENTDTLFLYINFDENKYIDIILNKT